MPRDDAGGAGRTGPDAGATRHDPLTLHRPRYRSGWLVVLELRDGAGRPRTLEVWSDAVDAASFSYLHLACLFDAAGRAPERSGPRAPSRWFRQLARHAPR